MNAILYAHLLQERPSRRLPLALLFALGVHVALLAGIGLGRPAVPFDPVLSFKVSLVERAGHAERDAPLRAPEPQPLPPVPAEPPPAVMAEPEPEPEPEPQASPVPAPPVISTQAPPAPARPVVAAPRRTEPKPVEPKPVEPRPVEPKPVPAPRPVAPPAPRRSGPLSAAELMGAGLDSIRQEAPLPAASSRGRSKRADPTDSSTLEGYYAAAWVAKVERIGALNFPEEARRRNLTGSLRLSVVIRADGTILETTVVRSSGQSALDEGARRIVELGAPYAPFPDELRRRYDTLVIVRDWQFRQGAQFQ